MRRRWIASCAVLALAASVGAAKPITLKTQADRESYGIGVGVARNLANQGIDVELEVMIQGIRDVMSGGKLRMTEEELSATMTAYTQALRQRQAQNDLLLAQENEKAGSAFLAANRGKPGVRTLADGVQYKVIRQGTGATPTDRDTVGCSYRGTLIDGTEFDASPADSTVSLPIAALIPGLREALKLMPVGSKWQIVIPSELAYGQHRSGTAVGPNSTLVFEVELRSIQ